jgi:Ti-type conjugative transfer relaxase TraA
MAIYHFSAKVISRASGSSALAAAAYRSASRLHDERLGRHHDFSNKAGVVHSEVLLPEGAPEHLSDRERLWNDVEAAEKRIDAQLAREVEFALPRELDEAEGVRLARDFVTREFVSRGMIADLNLHWDIGADGEPKPHTHVMLTMREVGEDGFGPKVREWNRTELLNHWREAWADHVNTRLVELDIDARIDHRSLEAQGIDLEPQHKIGPAASRMAGQGLESERADEHLEIARRNGERVLADPGLALEAITHNRATFTTRDLARFVHRHSADKEQFDRVFAAVKASPELVALGKDGRGEERFTSRTMIETEKRLEAATVKLDASRRHAVGERDLTRAVVRAGKRGLELSRDQRGALEHATSNRDLSNVVGYAGSGKSAMLGVAREAWELAGYEVQGAALSGIAAENLEAGSGIASRTLASLEHQWSQGRELLTDRHVLVIDEAGMIGTRQMERVLAEARKRSAKVVLVGDVEQLQAIEAGAAFRSIAERHGAVEITEIRRQSEEWQRDATRQLATGRTAEALDAYNEAGHVHAAVTREHARDALIDSWDRDRQEAPEGSCIVLAHTNEDVRELNEAARGKLREAGELGDDVRLGMTRGSRDFASGDRVMFLRNERSLGVKNGSLGTVRSVDAMRMQVMLDDGRVVAFDHKDYADIDHGYAATIHKAQGMTVDRVHVLATPGIDRHAAYVALSRHREQVDLHYGRDDFAHEKQLTRALSRERGKDMASDYAAEPDRSPELAPQKRDPFAGLKLRAGPLPGREHPEIDRARPGSFLARVEAATQSYERERSQLQAAVIRHARIVRDARATHARGEAYTGEQRAEVTASRAALDALRPEGRTDLENAFAADLSLIDEAAAGRTDRAIKAMEAETRWRTDPEVRAERFVAQWRHLRQRREKLGGWQHAEERDATDRSLTAMARSIDKDPKMGAALAKRASQLGLSRQWALEWSAGSSDGGIGSELQRSRAIGQALSAMLGRDRGLGL